MGAKKDEDDELEHPFSSQDFQDETRGLTEDQIDHCADLDEEQLKEQASFYRGWNEAEKELTEEDEEDEEDASGD